MAKFFDNVTGRQKVILLFGGFVLLIGAAVLFPEAYSAVIASIADLFASFTQFFRDLGGTQ